MKHGCYFISLPPAIVLVLSISSSTNAQGGRLGQWELLLDSTGIVPLHVQVLPNNKVLMFDRTDSISNLSFPYPDCGNNGTIVSLNCSCHSILYDISTNTFRPLFLKTNVWCSSGALDANGTLIQTGGEAEGTKVVRKFAFSDGESGDWVEYPSALFSRRWYATNQILPDGRVIIVSGRNALTYEYYPKTNQEKMDVALPFLQEARGQKKEHGNLYPFVYLLPSGHLYIFANTKSILFSYKNNTVLKSYPIMPGNEGRNFPLAGSSVMLPVRPDQTESSTRVEVLICGGAAAGNFNRFLRDGIYLEASKTCGRLILTESNPQWSMELMPMPRVNGVMIALPTGDVLLINGGQNGTAGYDASVNPALSPIIYKPNAEPDKRFVVLNSSTVPRMYHSTAVLLPSGKILVGGSNPHRNYTFKGVMFPTELRLEAFSPPYLCQENGGRRPSISNIESQTIRHNATFSVNVTLSEKLLDLKSISVVILAPSFVTHSFAMNQRIVVLNILGADMVDNKTCCLIMAQAPPTPNFAPPGYYMLFVVFNQTPSQATWIRFSYPY